MSTSTEPAISRGGKNFLRLKEEYGIYQASALGPLIEGLPSAREHLIEGLIPPRSVNILVGESGLGKSPLGYQMALAIATGQPFLGMTSRVGKVLYVDYENSVVDANWMIQQQSKLLGLQDVPPTFQLWPLHLNPMQQYVEEVIVTFAPDFVVVDSLRSFSPAMESDSTTAVAQIRRLRRIAAESGTAFLLIHHVSKRRGTTSLVEGSVMEWMLQASGVRALINQTDVRIAVGQSADGLTMRGHFRSHGEIGPFVLSRKRSGEDGEPLGYERQYVDAVVLENPEQQACFARLPEAFCFKDARMAYGKTDNAVNVFLQKMIRLGLANKTGYGKYCKTAGVCCRT